jgi:general stress protein 26
MADDSTNVQPQQQADKEPVAELQPQFSNNGATTTAWAEARERLEKAEVYWLSTVRPDGRPHVTLVVSVWLDGALYFCTGPGERKAKNLARNAHCVITTGCNALSEGLDLVVEGDAVKVSDEARLQRVADRYASKYDWYVCDSATHRTSGSSGPLVHGTGGVGGQPGPRVAQAPGRRGRSLGWPVRVLSDQPSRAA